MAGVSCKYHPEANLIEDYRAGDQVCSECGLVVGDRVIDVSCEWRSFSDKTGVAEDRSRVGHTNPLLDDDLSTIIVGGNGPRGPADPNRVLKIVFRNIAEIGEKLNLTKTIVDRANLLFKMVRDNKKLIGRSIEGVSPACVYIACRQEGVPRTFKEVCGVSNVAEKRIKKYFAVINKLFKDVMAEVVEVKSGDYMSRFCAMLGLPHNVQRLASIIANNAQELDLIGGRVPATVTAASIYLATKETGVKCNLKSIANVSGAAVQTIQSMYNIFVRRANDLITSKK